MKLIITPEELETYANTMFLSIAQYRTPSPGNFQLFFFAKSKLNLLAALNVTMSYSWAFFMQNFRIQKSKKKKFSQGKCN